MKPILLCLFVCCTLTAFKQGRPVNHAIQWQKSLGGSNSDYANSIQQTKDGSYIVAGYSRSIDGDVTGNHGGLDYWIVKLDSTGSIQWQKTLGGTSTEIANNIQRTKDGGYIVAGYSYSNDGDVSGNHGDTDYWIVKLNSTGTIQWQKSFGGISREFANSIQQIKDGGYIIAGSSSSNDGDVSGNHIYHMFTTTDYCVVKLDSTGTIIWQKSLGGWGEDFANSIQQTKDGGYIVAGLSNTNNNGDVSGSHGGYDYWIVKLNSAGTIQWQKSVGGTGDDEANNIQQTKDGGYIVAGLSNTNNNGDVSGSHGGYDYWIVKLDIGGNIQWQKSLGGAGDDKAYGIQQNKDSSYIVAGDSYSNDGDVSGHHGGVRNPNPDYWIVKLNSNGDIQKEESFGGLASDYAQSIQQTKDAGYIVAGYSNSDNADVSGNHGSEDYWIVKLKSKNSLFTSQDITSSYNNSVVENITQKITMHIQPNPSNNGLFTADFKEQKKNVVISVIDNAGKKVYADKISSAQQLTISLNNRPKGIYYLHVSYDGGSATAKLLVE